VVLFFCGFGKEITRGIDVPVIVTASPSYDATAAVRGGERFARGAQLLLLKSGKAEPLVDGFAASADASVSFDGAKVLFAAIKSVGEPWAIWELTLSDGSVRKVIGGDADVVRPLYLPDDRVVYARRTVHGFRMEAAQLDGSDVLLLTHVNASTIPVEVLADGRILFESLYPLGSGKTPEMYLRLLGWIGRGVVPLRSWRGALGRKALGVGRCGLYAWERAGAVYFAACGRGADCCTEGRVCGRSY
jgi:hypothetical protein